MIAGSYPPDGGGAERQMQRVLTDLGERGHDVAAVARFRPGAQRHYRLDGVEVWRIGKSAINPVNAALFTVQAAIKAARLRPDVLVALQAGSSPMAAALASATTRGRVPFIMRLTGPGVTGNQLAERTRRPIGRWLMQWLLKRAALIVSPAAHLFEGAGQLQTRVDEISMVIPNGAPRAEPLSELDEPDRPRIIWVGRDDAAKNYPAFLRLAAHCPDLTFTSVGIDPDLSRDHPNVRALGRVPEAARLIASATVLVSTSSREGSPNVVLEALAAGVKVVAFDLPGTREATATIDHGVIIVPQGDVEALASALRSALDDDRPVEGSVPTVEAVTDLWEQTLARIAGGVPQP